MKIKCIELFNIGPYEGINEFNIDKQNPKGKITVIGGKNGSGKTTLFSAIKLCLYGYRESGYQTINAYYKHSIKKLINDIAKLNNNTEAYVLLKIEIFNGQDWDEYSLKRFWTVELDKFETFYVHKNGILLSEEETRDFENYILNIVPPELFELYFFDGEQIADFFLEDESGNRIKKAFMTICGYDTFDIIYKNFKRLGKTVGDGDAVLDAYFLAKENFDKSAENLSACDRELGELSGAIDILSSELLALEKKYTSSGGVTLEEWNKNFLDLKNEEKIREEKNAWLKNAANEMIPYIILHDEIIDLVQQMNLEKDIEKQNILLEALNSMIPEILEEVSREIPSFNKDERECVSNKLNEIIINKQRKETTIFNLSKVEYELLLKQTSELLAHDKESILAARREIKKSLKRSKESRYNIEFSNVSGVDSFYRTKDKLINEKKEKVDAKENLLLIQKKLKDEFDKASAEYKIAEKDLEKHLKDESISNLTARSIRFLDILQKRLFRSEIEKVEKLFMMKMNQLMRKEQFISKIIIEDDFTIHVYRTVKQDVEAICAAIENLTPAGYLKAFGKIHCDELLRSSGVRDLDSFVKKNKKVLKEIEILIEFDKTIMSKGEKQVFIMALYWAIMELCNKQVPFIIDTPFARIDTIHRAHITKYFFKELRGQVLIFSTDEEITDEHIKVIGDDLQSKFLIENVDNSKTTITPGVYLGE